MSAPIEQSEDGDWIVTFCRHDWPELLIGPVQWLNQKHRYQIKSIDRDRIVFKRSGRPDCYMQRNGVLMESRG